ncbi:MAG: adenylate kinase family protein [Candidatus Bathyarchaeales archaeon]
MNAMIFGPPGSGKGTYASALEKRIGMVKISTGDIIREEIGKNTAIGRRMKDFYGRGELVPDSMVMEILKKRILQSDVLQKGFILDGYPRTIPQAQMLDKIVRIDVIINLKVPDWVIIERLSNRRICKKCGAIYNLKYLKPKNEGICDVCEGELFQRDDDKPEVIKERIMVYQKQTRPLLDYYKGKTSFAEVECNSPEIPPDVIVDKILKELKKLGFIK